MIVLINPHENTVTICGDAVEVYAIHDLSSIAQRLRHAKVIYVTEYVEVDGEEVVNILENMLESSSVVGDQTQIDSGILYLHTTGKAKAYVPFKNKDYYFNGMYDFKQISDLPENFIEECRMVRDGIKSGLFAVVDEYKRSELEKKRDTENVFVTNKKRVAEDSKGGVDDPIEIDLGGKVSFKRNNK